MRRSMRGGHCGTHLQKCVVGHGGECCPVGDVSELQTKSSESSQRNADNSFETSRVMQAADKQRNREMTNKVVIDKVSVSEGSIKSSQIPEGDEFAGSTFLILLLGGVSPFEMILSGAYGR